MKICQDLIDYHTKTTWNTPYVEINDNYIIRKFPSNIFEYDHTDGIGTKGIYHWANRTFKNAVLDALAMNLNDLLMMQVTPFKLQNHIILPKSDENAIKEIMTALSQECANRQIAITGGETSIHEFFMNELMDISITISGFSEKKFNNTFLKNDVLIGLPSSGLHSNGLTFVRNACLPFRKEFVEPTKIYNLPKCSGIHGIQHITGGAFTKIKRLLKSVDAYIYKKHFLKPQDIFYDVYRSTKSNPNMNKSINETTMYKTFNCGIGMVLSVSPNDSDYVIAFTGGEIIGEVREGNGDVFIESMFDDIILKL